MDQRLSVIIPVYNVEKYLRDCLESVINQTYKNLEIICVNDGSTDSSQGILEEFYTKDDRIKIINKENGGVASARNAGLEASSCQYITFVDSDDYIDLNTYEEALKHVKGADLVVFGSKLFGSSDYKVSQADQKYLKLKYKGLKILDNKIRVNTEVTLWNKIFKRDIIVNNDIKFPKGLHYEDGAFYWKYILYAKTAYFINRNFYFYRKHPLSIMAHTYRSAEYVIDNLYIIEDIYNYWYKNGKFEENIELFANIFERYFVFTLLNVKKREMENIFERGADLALKIFANKKIDRKWLNIESLKKRNYEYLFEPELKGIKRIFCIRNCINPYSRCKQKYMYILGKKIKLKEHYDPIKLSVIIPVYNVEKYLRDCLESVINQTYKNLEIICVNDGSTDSSQGILEEFYTKDDRIKIINKENGGVASARNAGLKASSCQYITFVDSDDYIDLNTYEEALKHVKGADLVVFGVKLFGSSDYRVSQADQKYLKLKYKGLKILDNEIRANTDVIVWNKIFKRDIIINNDIKFPKGLHYEDGAFYWKYILYAKTAYFINRNFYFYRKHPLSIMAHTYSGAEYVIDNLYIIEDIYNYWYKNGKFEENIELFANIFERYFRLAVIDSTEKNVVLDKGFNLAYKFFCEKKIQNSHINALLAKDFDKAVSPHLNFYQKIFSIKNVYIPSMNQKRKCLYFLGQEFFLD